VIIIRIVIVDEDEDEDEDEELSMMREAADKATKVAAQFESLLTPNSRNM
jgi:hypothetical protein